MREDAFALEQRLDQALEEDRLNREALEEERADQAFTLQEERHVEHDARDRVQRGSEELPGPTAPEEEYGTRGVGAYGVGGDGQAGDGDGVSFQAQQQGDGHGVPYVDQQHEYAADAMVMQDQEAVLDGESAGVSGAPPPEYGVGADVDAGGVGVGFGVASDEDEVDFVGEDEEDNVWQ